jgi:hypothetical protein
VLAWPGRHLAASPAADGAVEQLGDPRPVSQGLQRGTAARVTAIAARQGSSRNVLCPRRVDAVAAHTTGSVVHLAVWLDEEASPFRNRLWLRGWFRRCGRERWLRRRDRWFRRRGRRFRRRDGWPLSTEFSAHALIMRARQFTPLGPKVNGERAWEQGLTNGPGSSGQIGARMSRANRWEGYAVGESTNDSRGEPAGLGAATCCPACTGRLRAVSDGEMTNFLCRQCGRCWHVELGHISRVDPTTCPGCPFLQSCMSRYANDPAWRPGAR